MIYSKFKTRSIITVLSISVGLIVSSLLILFNYKFQLDIIGNILSMVLALCIIYIIMQMFLGELRSKAIKIIFSNNDISKRSFGGIGPKSIIYYGNIEGYKTSIVGSRSGEYEYLYLIVNSKRVIKLSEFYHENYKELKREIITKKIRNLGNEQWTIFIEIKDMFL